MSGRFELSPRVLSLTDRWLVLNKPAGWVTLPGRSGDHVPVLSEWAKEQFGALWVVHRLDRETSGVILFARTAQDHREANAWFSGRKTKKTYLLLAHGAPSAPFLRISQPIEGQASSTQVEVVEKFADAFLARAYPRTGRRHQIRIHLAQQGTPLLGDELYGGKKHISLRDGMLSIARVALHASQLELPTGERFEAPLAEDLISWTERLREEGRRI